MQRAKTSVILRWGRMWNRRTFVSGKPRQGERETIRPENRSRPYALSSRSSKQHAFDQRLAKRALRGDEKARLDLASRLGCIPALIRSLEGRLGLSLTTDDREEVIQNALLAMWKKLDTFQGTSKLETWAFGFCLNELRKWRAARGRGGRSLGDGELETSPQLVSIDPEQHDLTYLHEGLAELGRPASTVIRLKHFEELTFDQIGARMHLSPNTAKTTYYRGMQRLREALRSTWRQEQA